MTAPTLRVERHLLRDGASLVCGMDEVGRGALGGPVSVGAVVVNETSSSLAGVRDSKLLSASARVELAPKIRAWAVSHAVGHASAGEIDDHGLIWALRRAGQRALAQLTVRPDIVLLDGSHDWLSSPEQLTLLEDDASDGVEVSVPPVTMRVKADLTCTSVAAASVLAKVERDAILSALSATFPGYGWEGHKGYASAAHREALRRLGPCTEHRRSWRLGVDDEGAP